jgi:hypothetical protein
VRPACPTCGAGFRGGAECGRCGTDLRALSAILLAAREERELARRALLAGDGEEALRRVRRSLELHDVPAGRRLQVLSLLAAGNLREAASLLAALSTPVE